MQKPLTYITAFPAGQTKLFDMDESVGWVGELLAELNEDLTKEELAELDTELFLTIECEVSRKTTDKLEDHIKVTGKLSTVFGARCIKSGSPMIDNLELEIKFVVIDHELITRYGYEEETTLFVDGEEYELYSSQDNRFDIKDIFHEFIWLHKDPYPTLESDD
tara:strand:+ start:10755 stop:11243 length:489 start_codon:yes stop_codon:yes gene_type:complete